MTWLARWGPAALWAGVLFFLSAQRDLPPDLVLPVSDKLVHATLYFVLGAALAWGADRGRETRTGGGRPAHAVLVALGALYGASDEWHQSFVPGRDASAGDLLADVVGLLAGYVVVHHLLRRRIGTHRDASGRLRAPGALTPPTALPCLT